MGAVRGEQRVGEETVGGNRTAPFPGNVTGNGVSPGLGGDLRLF